MRLLSLILAFIMALFVAGCSDGGQPSDFASLLSSSANQPSVIPTESVVSAVEIFPIDLSFARQHIVSDNKKFGLIFLGTFDSIADCKAALETNNVGRVYPFLKEIPDERCVDASAGKYVYAVIPASESFKIEVRKPVYDENMNLVSEVASEVASDVVSNNSSNVSLDEVIDENSLYKSEIGEPIIIKCNEKDLYADAEISVTNPSLDKAYIWRPTVDLSGRSELGLTEREQAYICDIRSRLPFKY